MKRIMLAAGLVCAAGLVRAKEPILRVGIMTDTHIGETAESCVLVRKAFEVFRAQKADLIVNCGDIADKHYPATFPEAWVSCAKLRMPN